MAPPGLLCIGDAAHAMSPIGGVGINLAIQDAVAAANLLSRRRLQHGTPSAAELHAVQRRRELPTRVDTADAGLPAGSRDFPDAQERRADEAAARRAAAQSVPAASPHPGPARRIGIPSRTRANARTNRPDRQNPRAPRRNAWDLRDLGFGIWSYENPIQRPPHPTVDHSRIEVAPTMRIQNGPTRASSASVTRRRTVKVKRIARASAVIFVQNAKL